MTNEHDDLSRFKDAYLDYLEGNRDEPPAVDDLMKEHRQAAIAFMKSITAARGVDPYASRPSVEQLMESSSRRNGAVSNLGKALEEHLRLTVDARALVAPDAASVAFGLASTLVIQARGMRMRVVQEMTSQDLGHALASKAEEIAKVFSAFPDSHAVLYTTAGQAPQAVVLDNGDVLGAIEAPSGERRAPRLRRSVAAATTACEVWLNGIIPAFEPLRVDLLEHAADPEATLDPLHLASKVVDDVSTAGVRARVEAKRATWQDFGDAEAQYLAAIVEEARRGHLSQEVYESRVDELVRMAA